jgi:hypothetical protein
MELWKQPPIQQLGSPCCWWSECTNSNIHQEDLLYGDDQQSHFLQLFKPELNSKGILILNKNMGGFDVITDRPWTLTNSSST